MSHAFVFADPGARPRGPASRALDLMAWLSAALFALLVRALSFPRVFQRGEVVFAPGDAMYHLRRALYSFENFPQVLMTDAYVNHPGGASIPWPPLFDIASASVARLLVEDVAGFETVMAWAPAVLGALTTLPIFWLVARHASRMVAFCAASIYAIAPVAVSYARIGNPDHHAAVAFVGAWWLVLGLALVDASVRKRSLARLAAAYALVALALLFTWHGSLLYLGLGQAMVIGIATLRGDVALLRAQAFGGLASLCVAAYALSFFPEPLGGLYSSIAPSRLHLIALAAVVCVPALVAVRSGPTSSASSRLGWLAAGGIGFAILVLLFPGPREGLEPAMRFLTMTDGVGAVTSEQRPLFAFVGRAPGPGSDLVWGAWAYLIAPVPFLSWWALCRSQTHAGASAEDEAAARWTGGGLVLWVAVFGLLALSQRRYGNDLAPGFAISLAIGLAYLARVASQRLAAPAALWGLVAAIGLGFALHAPIRQLYWPLARQSYAWLIRPELRQRITPTAAYSVHRFARAVREVTPETSGFLDASLQPEYGVVSHANLGHALQYLARRPTPTDPFWAYIGPENWQRAFALLHSESEREALRYARELNARYVVTTPDAGPRSFAGWLHATDGGGGTGIPRLASFRLATEISAQAPTLGEMFGRPRQTGTIPYKLFEIVPGAVLRVRAAPGVPATATLGLRTSAGRSFRYRAVGIGTAEGVAEIRVPYASGATGHVRSDPSYQILIGERRGIAIVREGHVLQGATIDIDLEAPPS